MLDCQSRCWACVDKSYKRSKYTWWYTLNNIELAGFWIRALDDNLPFKLRPHYHYCPHANNMFVTSSQVYIQYWVITHARTTYIATHVYKFIQVHTSSHPALGYQTCEQHAATLLSENHLLTPNLKTGSVLFVNNLFTTTSDHNVWSASLSLTSLDKDLDQWHVSVPK